MCWRSDDGRLALEIIDKRPLDEPPPNLSVSDRIREVLSSAAQPVAFDSFAEPGELSALPQPTSLWVDASSARLTPHGPGDTGFGLLAPELQSLIEEKMQRAAAEPARPSAPAAPAVEDDNLFADEQQFFNLAEELERELTDEATPPVAPVTRTSPESLVKPEAKSLMMHRAAVKPAVP